MSLIVPEYVLTQRNAKKKAEEEGGGDIQKRGEKRGKEESTKEGRRKRGHGVIAIQLIAARDL